MPTTDATGFDGYASLTTAHNASLGAWSADFSRVVSDVTAFGNTGRKRRLGLYDVTGSASGTMDFDASNTGPGVNDTDWARSGQAITLGVVGSTQCIYVVTAAMSQISIGSQIGGDATITFNFQNSGGTLPTETWDET